MAPSASIRTVIFTPDRRQEGGSTLYATTDIDTAIDTEQATALAPTAPAPSRVTTAVVVFHDLVESTPLLVRIGDEAYVQLLDRLDAVRTHLADHHRGRVVSLAGDGAMLLFDRTDDAIEFARAFNRTCDDLGVQTRTGIHLGEVQLRRGGQVGGLAVHTAARIESAAPVGGMLVSAAAAATSMAELVTVGWSELKGIPGATRLEEVVDPR